MADEACQDILLKPHAAEIRKQALLYVFEVQARLDKSESDVSAFCDANGIDSVETAINEVENNMKQTGLIVNRSSENDGVLQIQGNQFDVKGKILNATTELYTRAENLRNTYEKHQKQLEETIQEQKQRDAAAAAEEKKKKT